MIVQDLSFPDPQKNLDYDDELLRKADRAGGGEALRFWESPVYFVVLGRTCVLEDDVCQDMAEHNRIPVLRRSSGGGTVLQGPGCLNFSVVLSKTARPELQSIANSYQFILSKVISGLAGLNVSAEFRPISDLVLREGEKKFSGNAQRRGREFILHHGTILYDFNLSLIPRYLNMPKKIPDYRRGRPHSEFITNIPVDPSALKPQLVKAFSSLA